jgi:hypothetical protein
MQGTQKGLETREQIVLSGLLDFFAVETNFKTFVDIVFFKTHKIPLRMFNWFVTNYTKKKDVTYTIKRPNNTTESFCVHRSYQAQLNGYKKYIFDPYCRSPPLVLEYQSPVDGARYKIETAICQLKFFKWVIENLVINYMLQNHQAIYDDMIENEKARKLEGGTRERRKKNELSQSVYQQFNVSTQPIVMNFNKV